MTEENNEKKKYTIVDKRRGDEEQAEPEAKAAPQPEAPRPEAGEQKQEPASQEQQEQRSPGIIDAYALILNLLREHALTALGMSLPVKGEFTPDTDGAQQAASIFHTLMSKFPTLLPEPEQSPEEANFKPEIAAVLAMGLNVIQSQVIVHMGLIADPATGLIMRDLAQAKTGIDIFTELVGIVKPMMPPQVATQLDGALSDLKINYVKQLGA